MLKPTSEPFVILHFRCQPPVKGLHRMLPKSSGYRVSHSSDGFETIQRSESGTIDVLVLELDRNHCDVLFLAQEVKRVDASIPIILLAHAAQSLDGLSELAHAVIEKDSGSELLQSLEQLRLWKQSNP